MLNLKINSVLVYSELSDKYFFTEFGENLNIIYGKNTAGKSTLIQLVLYAFGINDNKLKLTEILSEEIFVRLDCTLRKDGISQNYVFVRQDETLIIQDNNEKTIKFNGIGSDQSAEHIKLKKFFNDLFDFNLMLESTSGISEAPMETIFLPYYVSQDVGWVYLRKSFSNLNFYKNFKEDFLDYYLGIENSEDRKEKREIETLIKSLQQQISFFNKIETDNEELEVSQIIEDSFSGKSNEFIDNFSGNKSKLLELENKQIKESNNLAFLNQRLSVVSKVNRNHKNQKPGTDSCPTCSQTLPKSIEDMYEYFQEENDTSKIQSELKEKIKKSQASINSINKKISSLKEELESETRIYNQYSVDNLTFESWINNKANIQLNNNITSQVGRLSLTLEEQKEKLSEFKTDSEILSERSKKSKIFKDYYKSNNAFLGLPELKESRFNDLYDISSFPFQGVQLHLAVLSYHFAFNRLLTDSSGIHRIPFILDSIFKEDIEQGTKNKILKFINSHHPKDTQTILSIADDKNVDSKIETYSSEFFNKEAKMICIGEGVREKSLLIDNDGEQKTLIENSFELLENEH